MKGMKQYYNIEQIQDKYYIFNSLIMKFERIPFNTEQEAQEHIDTIIFMCEYMCN